MGELQLNRPLAVLHGALLPAGLKEEQVPPVIK